MNTHETQRIYEILKVFSDSVSGLNSVADLAPKYDKDTINVLADGAKTYSMLVKSYVSDLKAHGEDTQKVELILSGLYSIRDYLEKVNNLNLLTHEETVVILQYVNDQAYLIRRLFKEYILN